MFKQIVILGAGNVATHFMNAISLTDIQVLQIYSRTEESAASLAGFYKTKHTSKLTDITEKADAYFFMLSDTGLIKTINNFPYRNRTLIHTAGSINADIFGKLTDNYGVLYPYQTFTKSIETDFSKTPLCIEASGIELQNCLMGFAEKLGCKYYFIDTQKRKILHLAAVFACNFMNHCIDLGERILESNEIDRNILFPLISQSLNKLNFISAAESQTGPAHRGDMQIINEHIKLLQYDKDLAELYKIITQSIISKKTL